jgi:hypothetical protein
MACRERWLDVFVTKPDTGIDKQVYEYDDQFACTVQSVRISTATATTAMIVDAATDWILPTWTATYAHGSYSGGVYDKIEVGDLVRIGVTGTNGHTDYLTVLEKRVVTLVYNSTATTIPIGFASESSVDLASAGSRVVPSTGIAHIALRLNQSVNCTAMPTNYPKNANELAAYNADGTLATGVAVTIETRDEASLPTWPGAQTGETDFYPLYVHKRWLAGSTLRAALDHGVKQCSCIKLVGYSVANKRQVGLHHAHEMQADDYLVLRINEIEGHVVSNNRFANGAFAVLYSGSSADNRVGAVEYSQFDTVNGVVVQDLDATNSVLRNLTLEITDRKGNPAHFGRMHLWFKLLVTHG